MTLDTCALLAKYNSHVNNEMFRYIGKLSKEEWEKEFPGYFKSVKAMCNHIYIADFSWLKRLGAVRKFNYLSNPVLQENLTVDSKVFDSIDEYGRKRKELDELMTELVSELTEADLRMDVTYKSLKGVLQTKNVGGSVMHFFNHGTHHRGMISLYLEFMGHDNDFNGLIAVV
jgi:uncharacterized damage-inducible protein DinB